MNKRVLITGTSKGIGQNIEETLLNLGYKVFSCARTKLNKENYISLDLTKKENVDILYSEAVKYLGGVDILINNAGEYSYSKIEDMKYEKIQNMVNLNFIAPYYLTSLVISNMKENKWGRIINIGSISGVVGEAYATLYSGTKSAFLGFSKALALEVAEYNITVNTISPGWVESELSSCAIEDSDFTLQDTIDTIPQKRFIEPVEISNLVKYLISNEAQGLTGQNINLCAGLSCG